MLDILVSTVLLVLMSPLIAVIAVVIRVTMGAPVIFQQQRPGLGGKPFTMMKFRTMRQVVDSKGLPLSDTSRLTSLGKWLRKLSLDELPELFNVLKGEMSLVGPRPLVCRYLPYYTPREQLRHSVRPGITGWAQVHGRNQVSWDRRLALDVYYVEHQSLALDLRILLQTMWIVVLRRGVEVDPMSVMLDLDQERGGQAHCLPHSKVS